MAFGLLSVFLPLYVIAIGGSLVDFWRKGGNSTLIKLGLALIAFPEPVISDIIGASLVALGTIQEGIRRRTIYVEDVYKTFHETLKDIWNIKHSF